MVIVVILKAVVFLSCCSTAAAAYKQSALRNATTVTGHPVVLNCVMPITRVLWLRVIDGLPVLLHINSEHSVDDSAGPAARFVVVGNTTAGEHHLLIRYTVFPDDAGLWTCVSASDSQLVQHTQLMILVPPATQVPEVFPVVVNKSLSQRSVNDVYTVSCVAHFAFPPVDLVWVKEYGPNVKYSVSPPTMLVSRRGTISSRVTLVLTPSNAASLFACVASHPTFVGEVGRQTVQFMLPNDVHQAHAQAQLSSAEAVEAKSDVTVSRQVDVIDRACLLTAIVLITSCLVIILILSKCTSDWRCVPVSEQTRTSRSDNASETVDGETTSMMVPHTASHPATDARVKHWPTKRQHRSKLVMFITSALLLMSSLVFCFPLYLKEVTAPVTDTDEVQALFAGSALWLDCRSMVQPVDSLVQVSWYRDNELLYYQYLVNSHAVSYPPNTTTGVMFHARASSESVGQVTVWPVAPGEGGVYSCHVIMSGSDDVTNVHRHKTIAVFIFTGAVVNYALLVCLSVAALSAASVILLVLQHAVRCRCTASTRLTGKQDSETT